MATKQASKAASGASKAGAARKPGQSSPPTGSLRGEPETGERDETYNLVSVLYHALQGAETIRAYISDAEQVEDEELAEFFEETRTEYVARAAQAKRLLAARLEDETEEEDELFEDEEEGDEEEEED